MKTILVTGSAGFIGSNLVLRLFKELSEGTIVGLDNLNDYYDPTLKDYRLSEIEKATNDGNRTNLAGSKIQTSRSWNYWLEREFELSYAPFCAQALRGGLASQVEELPIVI